MNDAWNVIGWTNQKPLVIFADSVNAPWKIPADIDTVTVLGEYHSMDGGLATGYVEFVPSVPLTHALSKVSLLSPTFVGRIGMDGRFSLRLPATDSAGIVENDWNYTVTVVLGRKVIKQFPAVLPRSLVSVDLFDLMFGSSVVLPADETLVDGGNASDPVLVQLLDGGQASTATWLQVIDEGIGANGSAPTDIFDGNNVPTGLPNKILDGGTA